MFESPKFFEVGPRFQSVCAREPIFIRTLILSCFFYHGEKVGAEGAIGHGLVGKRGKTEHIVETVDEELHSFVW